jgi:hypothetical protein
VTLLLQDHDDVSDLLDQFADARDDQRAIGDQICQIIATHAQIQDELLYPAARDAFDTADQNLITEANVENSSMRDLLSQLQSASDVDDLYRARVKVLGDQFQNHARGEEDQFIPALQQADLDLDTLGQQLADRRTQLLGDQSQRKGQGQGQTSARSQEETEDESAGRAGRPRSSGRSNRPSMIHSGRR